MSHLLIGTCSWKYDSWRGIIYPDFGEFNYLEKYSKNYNIVEVDQWFWPLFDIVTVPEIKSSCIIQTFLIHQIIYFRNLIKIFADMLKLIFFFITIPRRN
jgi:hypothetical protein